MSQWAPLTWPLEEHAGGTSFPGFLPAGCASGVCSLHKGHGSRQVTVLTATLLWVPPPSPVQARGCAACSAARPCVLSIPCKFPMTLPTPLSIVLH